MTAEKITALLEDKDSLHSISISELESLVQLYPFAQVFKELLLKKQLNENQAATKNLLISAAVGSIDRTHLFHMVHSEHKPITANISTEQSIQQHISNKNDDEWNSLEFTEENELENALSHEFTEINKLIERGVEGVNQFTYETQTIVAPEFVILDLDEIINVPFDSHKFEEKDIEVNEEIISEIQTVEINIDTLKKDEIYESKYNAYINYFFENKESIIYHFDKKQAPLVTKNNTLIEAKVLKITTQEHAIDDQSNFVHWLKKLKTNQIQNLEQRIHKKEEFIDTKIDIEYEDDDLPSKKKKRRMHPIAESSIQPNNEIATETLAKLLTLQGKKEEGIAMYNQLILLFPEKSAYFAHQIEILNKNI